MESHSGSRLEYITPFRDDETCIRWMRYPKPPDRRRRLELFAEAYGMSSVGLVDEVIAVQTAGVETVRRMAEEGHERQVAMVDAGDLERLQARGPFSRRAAERPAGSRFTRRGPPRRGPLSER